MGYLRLLKSSRGLPVAPKVVQIKLRMLATVLGFKSGSSPDFKPPENVGDSLGFKSGSSPDFILLKMFCGSEGRPEVVGDPWQGPGTL